MGGDIGHARVAVDGPNGVPHGLVLLDDGKMALVVLPPLAVLRGGVKAAIQEEPGQLDVLAAFAGALEIVYEAAEPHQRLLHSLVLVVPRLRGGGTDVVAPAVREFSGRVVEARVLSAGGGVVVDGGLQKVAGDIALVIGAPLPSPEGAAGDLAVASQPRQGEGRLEVSIRFLGGQDLGDPVFERRPHLLMRRRDLRIAPGIHHQGDAHRLHGLVHPGVGEDVALVRAVRFAAQRFAGFDEVVDAAGPLG
jgi:hypothetical protein